MTAQLSSLVFADIMGDVIQYNQQFEKCEHVMCDVDSATVLV